MGTRTNSVRLEALKTIIKEETCLETMPLSEAVEFLTGLREIVLERLDGLEEEVRASKKSGAW